MSRFSSSTLISRRRGLAGFLFILLIGLVLLPGAPRAAVATQSPLELDVPFVPTPPEVVEKMLQMAEVSPTDFLIDLGAGDGRIAVAAVRDYGAKGAFGVDIDPERVKEANANAEQAGVADRIDFEVQDLFDTDFSKATVLSMYLLPNVNMKLRPKVLQLAPGTRVVSHAFSMGDWEPDALEDVDGRDVYFWVVPADVAGQWEFSGPDGTFMIDVQQQFQKLTASGTEADDQPLSVTAALRGDVIRLDISREGAAPQHYIGRVEGDTIAALADGDAAQGWRASRR